MTRRAALVGLLMAGWPVLRWYGLRLHDGSDEPLGLVAVAAALVFAPRSGWHEALSRRSFSVLLAILVVYVAVYAWLPALGRALLVVLMLGIVVAPRGLGLAWTALLLLSLPVLASLQFYFGYPLRVPTTHLSAGLLRLCGISAHAEGTTLLWAGERVIVDAPCSGIQMAWAGAFLAAVLACWQRLPTSATLRLFRWAGAIVFAANVVRSAALFCLGAGLWHLPPWAHEGLGVAAFAMAAGLIGLMATRRQNSVPCAS